MHWQNSCTHRTALDVMSRWQDGAKHAVAEVEGDRLEALVRQCFGTHPQPQPTQNSLLSLLLYHTAATSPSHDVHVKRPAWPSQPCGCDSARPICKLLCGQNKRGSPVKASTCGTKRCSVASLLKNIWPSGLIAQTCSASPSQYHTPQNSSRSSLAGCDPIESKHTTSISPSDSDDSINDPNLMRNLDFSSSACCCKDAPSLQVFIALGATPVSTSGLSSPLWRFSCFPRFVLCSHKPPSANPVPQTRAEQATYATVVKLPPDAPWIGAASAASSVVVIVVVTTTTATVGTGTLVTTTL
mmetsp:Transcript_108367/g.272582  ORF Transcript_108367/g.272582 Transcript_108367/m.272582 type:complete len:299 (+) Transcript_108367:467-1363(+)